MTTSISTKKFGERIRELRYQKGLSQRDLAALVGVTFTYVSRIETRHLDYGDYPSGELIAKLAKALETDEDELFILAEKIPPEFCKQFFARPEFFLRIAKGDAK